jgi:hypothetical protein
MDVRRTADDDQISARDGVSASFKDRNQPHVAKTFELARDRLGDGCGVAPH